MPVQKELIKINLSTVYAEIFFSIVTTNEDHNISWHNVVNVLNGFTKSTKTSQKKVFASSSNHTERNGSTRLQPRICLPVLLNQRNCRLRHPLNLQNTNIINILVYFKLVLEFSFMFLFSLLDFDY